MALYVAKNPDPYTRAIKIYGDSSPGTGFELMTEQAFAAWLAQQPQPPISKPAPEPAWDQFSLSALADPGLNLAVLAADPSVPNAARGLSAALLEAKLRGEYVNFAACWQAVVSVAQIPPSRVAELVALAQACHLPEAFIDAISPS
jgi:hypothetical protein